MKKTLLALLLFTALFNTQCKKDDALETDQVLVRFDNTLPEAITGARLEFDDIHKTDIGLIPANSTTGYIAFDYFQTGADLPMGMIYGKQGDADFTAWAGLWCGTGVEFKQLEPGFYTIRIEGDGEMALMRFVE
jgi:hypothetical protein